MTPHCADRTKEFQVGGFTISVFPTTQHLPTSLLAPFIVPGREFAVLRPEPAQVPNARDSGSVERGGQGQWILRAIKRITVQFLIHIIYLHSVRTFG